MSDTYDVKITTSAETRALEEWQRQLVGSITNARAAGLATKELERELAGVNKQLGQARVNDHVSGLRELVTAQKTAGKSTEELERRLEKLSSLKPVQVETVGRMSAAETRALSESSSDLERSLRRRPPALPAAGAPRDPVSAETRGFEAYQKALAASIQSARDVGLATRAMEKELEGVNRQLGQSRLRDHAAALRESIAQTRAAGQSTAQLERQLRQLETLRPQTTVGKFFAGVRDTLRDIPGVGGFVRAFNGSSAAVAALTSGMALLAYRAATFFSDFVKGGISFNATLEQAQLGVAAVFKQFDRTGQFANFDAAMRASAQAIDMLKAAAASSPASFDQLLGAYQGTAGSMAATGMSIKQQIDTISLMSQTLAGLGIRPEQMLQETRAILTGNITEDALAAKTLGITPDMVRQAKEQGRLYEFLQEKMAGFAEAGERAGSTLTVKWSNVGDRLQQISAAVTKPGFEALKSMAGLLDSSLQAIQDATGTKPGASPLEPVTSEAEKAAQKVRDLNQARLDDLAKSAAGASAEFDKLTKSIAEAYKMEMALADAQSKLALARIDRSEQEQLAGATGDPKRQAAIKAQFAEQRIRETYAGEDKQLRLQIDSQRSLRANAFTQQRAADRAAESARLLALGAAAEKSVAANDPALQGAVRAEALTDPGKLAEDLHALQKRKIELEEKLSPRSSLAAAVAKGVMAGGGNLSQSIGTALADYRKNGSERSANQEELAQVNARIAAAEKFNRVQSNATALSLASGKAEKDLAKVRAETVATAAAAEKQIEQLGLGRQAAADKARAALAANRNEQKEATATEARQDRDRRIELDRLQAVARGDKREVTRAEWMKNYFAQFDKDRNDAAARQMANAQLAASKPFNVAFSNEAQNGGAMGESLAAARAALAAGARGPQAYLDPLKDVAANTSKTLGKLDAVVSAVKDLKTTARPGLFMSR